MKWKQQLIVLVAMLALVGCSEKKDIAVREEERFTVWQYVSKVEDATKLRKETRFELAFTKHVIDENANPFDPAQLPGENQRWFGIRLRVKNTGSKWSPMNYACFVRMNDGSDYRLAPWIEGDASFLALNPDETGVIQLTCRFRKQVTPIEVFGWLGGAVGKAGATQFSCQLH